MSPGATARARDDATHDDATHDRWELVGEGVYRTSSSTEMQMRFFLADDFSFGSAGDPVRENLFSAATAPSSVRDAANPAYVAF